MSDLSFWEADDAEGVKVRETVVAPVAASDVDDFCRRYHYAVTGGNKTWRWGLWHGPTLLGVIAYNLPSRETCESLFGPEHRDRVWHMGRLAMADSAPRNSESRLIGGSLRLIRKDHPEVWAVVTFAATDQGHLGYVYQATNALYLGTGGDGRYFRDQHGQRRSRKQGGRNVSAAEIAAWGWTAHREGVKHRYLYLLGSRTQRKAMRALLRLPVLPYPKREERAA